MKQKTLIEKLYEALKFLVTTNKYKSSPISIFSFVKGVGISSSLIECQLILEQLHKDGFVDFEKEIDTFNRTPFSKEEYKINFNGLLFYEQGGYFGKSINAVRSEKRIRKNDILLIIGTWLAGIGTLALTVWEIYKHYWLHVD